MYTITNYITFLLTTLLFLATNSSVVKAQDTISIYYNIDAHQLTNEHKVTIDSLVYFNIIKDNRNIIIVGYTDYLGDTIHNNTLSQNRAIAVKSYLSSMGIRENAIIVCLGKGEIPRATHVPKGYAPDRRVDIILNSTQPIAPKPKSTTTPPKQHQINNTPIGKTIVLNKIFFHTGRHFITDKSLPELENLYQTLKDNPTLRIRIEGHVCCVWYGPDALDEDTQELSLSVNRAIYIYDYLIKKGISEVRLEYAGFGRRRPLVKHEKSAEDEAKNRRVEIRVLSR